MTLLATPPLHLQRTDPLPTTREDLGLPTTFTNPLFPGADPWVTRHGQHYYFCQAHADRITVAKSSSPLHPGPRATVFAAPRRAWNSSQVWAPELHRVHNRWYIYYAASAGHNESHRMGVLESATDDPQGPYLDRGCLYTGDRLPTRLAASRRDGLASDPTNRWAIDGTLLLHHNQLYFLWSGWEDHRDIQHLYIAKMSDPYTISSDRVRLCPNDDHPWERVSNSPRHRGLHEAPQILHRHNKIHLIFSCSGSWQPSYKLGLLHMDASADPMNPTSWTKHPTPIFSPTSASPGVGHCSFTTSPDGTEDWILYHAKSSHRETWADRTVRAQPFSWTKDGLPSFGSPADPHSPLPLPSGLSPTPHLALAS